MSNVTPFKQRLLGPLTPEEARDQGFTCLTPTERAIAIEFATTGHTVKQIASDLGQPVGIVRDAMGSPIVRALIHDLQNELAAHKIINAAWVEQQIMALWPQFTGEEDVALINKSGEQVFARKFHAPEVSSILKHFGGNKDQKGAGGVHVQINFGDMGVQPVSVNVIEQDTSGE